MVQRTNTKAIEKMEVKKGRPQDVAQAAKRKRVVEFVGDVKQELRKVEWTSGAELKAYTKIVVASTFLLGLAIYFIDLGIQGFLNGIQFIVRALVG